MLGEKLDRHGAAVWLVNTGWTGGPFGEGQRMPIQATRAMLRAALSGELADGEYREDETFGFDVPLVVPGVEDRLLDPRSTWADADTYDRKARELARKFRANFESYAGRVSRGGVGATSPKSTTAVHAVQPGLTPGRSPRALRAANRMRRTLSPSAR